MTVENCIKLLKAYEKQMNNPDVSTSIKKQSQANYEMMKKHILECGKFKDNPVFNELQGKKKVSAKIAAKPAGVISSKGA